MTLAGGFLTSLASMPVRLLPLPLVSRTYPDPLGSGPGLGGSRYNRATMRNGPLQSGLVGLGVLAFAVGQTSAQLAVDTVPELGLSSRFSGGWWLSGSRTLWLLTLVLSCIIPLALALMRRRRIAELIMKIPGPHVTHPVLGNLDVLFELNKYRHLLSPHILLLQTMCGLAEIYDSERIFRFWLGFRPVVAFFKAESVEVILSSNTVIDKSFDYTLLHPWLGTGLLTSWGGKWRLRRKMLTPAFHFRILEDFVPIFNEQAQIFASLLQPHADKRTVDIVPYITMCTLDIICETAMGVKVGAQQDSNSRYVRALYEVGETFMARIMRPWLWPTKLFFMSARGRRFQENLSHLHNFTRKVIQDRKAELLKEKNGELEITQNQPDQHMGVKRRKAFLDLLLGHHLQNNALSLEDIREEVDTFMFEGHDTTAMGIAWSMYLIGLHEDAQKKIQEELDSIFGDDRERHITTDDLKRMKYLECAIKEAQRLFPSVPFIGRELMEDVVVNGYTVPRGTTCFVFTYMLHRDKQIFPNPEAFIPERFLPENSIGRHPFSYVPFSAGPRNCIGQKFALMEEKVVCATLLRRYQIQSVHHRDKIHLLAELVIRSKQGLRVRFRERPPSHNVGHNNSLRWSCPAGPARQHWLSENSRLFDDDMRLHSI